MGTEKQRIRYSVFFLQNRNWWSFFCKGQGSKYFQLCKPYGLCRINSTLPPWHKSSHRQYTHEGMWLCFNKASFIGTEMWISYNFEVSQNILLLRSSTTENVENILCSQARPKQLVDLCVGVCDPILKDQIKISPFSYGMIGSGAWGRTELCVEC